MPTKKMWLITLATAGGTVGAVGVRATSTGTLPAVKPPWDG
jgi:hypothetical protein